MKGNGLARRKLVLVSPKAQEKAPCPCGTGASYRRCCAPYLAGEREAPTAEALMRARYSANARGDVVFLTRSWHPDTLPTHLIDPTVVWTGLEVRATDGGRALDRVATVTFLARYRRGAHHGVLSERSRFQRMGTRWVYVDGEVDPSL